MTGNSSAFKTLYECQCKELNRALPFRAQFIDAVVDDIQKLFPPTTTPHLTYVSDGPGGLLTDFIILNKLIAAGFTDITFVGIEERLDTNAAIVQAALDFREWWQKLPAAIGKKITVQTFLYRSWTAYQKACATGEVPQGNILVCVDPDDCATIPDFSDEQFRKRCSARFKKTLQPPAAFYYLYFQKISNHNYRHMIMGRFYRYEKKPLLALQHSYGEKKFKQQNNQLFWDDKPVYPFSPDPTKVQVGEEIVASPVLIALLNNPLARSS